MHAFKVGDRVLIHPSAFTRAGESAAIIGIYGDVAAVAFDDGNESAYIISDGELVLQDSINITLVTTTSITH